MPSIDLQSSLSLAGGSLRQRLPSRRVGLVHSVLVGLFATLAVPGWASSVGASEASDSPTSAVLIEGRVVAAGGQAVSGAEVSTLEGRSMAATDDAGSFSLRAQVPVDLLIAHPRYELRSIRVRDAADDLVVELDQGLEESVTVTAKPVGSTYSPEVLTGTTVDPLDQAGRTSTLVDAAARIPGVSENGQGGIFRVLSIRGISRQRVLTLFDGVRLTSERRAGVSASFVDPELLGEVDVRRGPASTYLGAGALGGAIDLLPRSFARLSLSLGYESQGDARSASVGWGDGTYSLGMAHRAADDTETPDGEQLFSRYEQTSATARGRWDLGPGTLDALAFGSLGEEIGKSSSDFPERRTIYPDEQHLIGRVVWTQGDRLLARVFVHPQELETRVDRDFIQTVDNDSEDFGLHFEHRIPFGDRPLDGRVGVDSFQRRDVDARELTTTLDGDVLGDFQSLEDGRLEENGVFAIVNGGGARFQLEGGARYTDHRQRNGGLLQPREASSASATTGFVGGAAELPGGLRIYSSFGLGQRFPTLSERFFTGVTGRGEVVGNPDLRDETSENLELGLRWAGRRAAASFAVYRNEIDDYIERIEIGDGLLSFRNLNSGTIEGFELDGFVILGDAQRSRLEWQAHRIEGRSRLDEPLADIPVDRLRASLHHQRARWHGRFATEWRDAKRDPGPSERAIPSAFLVEASVAFRLGADIELRLDGSNLLDETYFASADDQGPLAPGRSLGLLMRWQLD